MCAQWPQVFERSATLREHAALQRNPGSLGGAEDAHAADRVIAREHYHFHALPAFGVEGQQLLDQRKRHAGAGGRVQAVELQLHVGLRVLGVEQAVFFFEVEQRARRDCHHQLVFQRDGHGSGTPTSRTDSTG
ncbi:hypothetical protein SDC9_87844 [bioreactor metagenome]|uniref:Uncharacterized protein n=1 Tax=bioreactor metagenome TaxID=1076179 RepID=A0A644ZUE5_9ZZZZ